MKIDFNDIVEEEYNVDYFFIGYEDFYSFLVENYILDKWVYNLEFTGVYDLVHNEKYYHYIKDFLKDFKDFNYIDCAFDWDNTEDGFDFWDELNMKWFNSIELPF